MSVQLRGQGSPVSVHRVNRPEHGPQLGPGQRPTPCGRDVCVLFSPKDVGSRRPRLCDNKGAALDTRDPSWPARIPAQGPGSALPRRKRCNFLPRPVHSVAVTRPARGAAWTERNPHTSPTKAGFSPVCGPSLDASADSYYAELRTDGKGSFPFSKRCKTAAVLTTGSLTFEYRTSPANCRNL